LTAAAFSHRIFVTLASTTQRYNRLQTLRIKALFIRQCSVEYSALTDR
jgi:hypothetical protein